MPQTTEFITIGFNFFSFVLRCPWKVRTFWCKNVGCFEIHGVSARIRGRGVEPLSTFFGQGGGGQFFKILCGRPLWTAPLLALSGFIATKLLSFHALYGYASQRLQTIILKNKRRVTSTQNGFCRIASFLSSSQTKYCASLTTRKYFYTSFLIGFWLSNLSGCHLTDACQTSTCKHSISHKKIWKRADWQQRWARIRSSATFFWIRIWVFGKTRSEPGSGMYGMVYIECKVYVCK